MVRLQHTSDRLAALALVLVCVLSSGALHELFHDDHVATTATTEDAHEGICGNAPERDEAASHECLLCVAGRVHLQLEDGPGVAIGDADEHARCVPRPDAIVPRSCSHLPLGARAPPAIG